MDFNVSQCSKTEEYGILYIPSVIPSLKFMLGTIATV